MSKLSIAKSLAKEGFYIFPAKENGKHAAMEGWQQSASKNPDRLDAFWKDPVSGYEYDYNIGISTSKYGSDGECLIVVDVDDKGKRKGSEDIMALDLQGKHFPKTRTTFTPTGGRHLYYRSKKKTGNRKGFPAPGLDIRGIGGLVVGPGSTIEGKGRYTTNNAPIVECPKWLLDTLNEPTSIEKKDPDKSALEVDQAAAKNRAMHYLQNEAPIAVEGDGGDHTTFVVACKLRDIGLTQDNSFELLAEEWNPKCEPPWSADELEKKIANAYEYSRNKNIGASAPESVFSDVEDEQYSKEEENSLGGPITEMNRKHAFVIAGDNACVLWERKDEKGYDELKYLTLFAFEKLYAPYSIQADAKVKPLADAWLKSPLRRSYNGICFSPSREVSKNYYNLWKGLCLELPKPKEKLPQRGYNAVERFKEHALENVCKGDKRLYAWLMGYFAHMVQRPGEKPLTALVFKGKKGTGKNALIGRVAAIFRDYSFLASKRGMLVGRFNAHLERLILLVLDEAFWSGDKEGEGVLKDLVTGDTHNIEHKGKAIYTVDNLVRVVIIGNEEWLVPASDDERRYCVFEVGEGRMQDTKYFEEMRIGMENYGGDRLLLQYLTDFDLSKTDVNVVPKTEGLLNQKIESLNPSAAFWFQCLTEGEIPGSSFEDDTWPEKVEKFQMRSSAIRYARERNIRGYIADDRAFGRTLKNCCPSIEIIRKRVNGERSRIYTLPGLEVARKQFSEFIGHEIEW